MLLRLKTPVPATVVKAGKVEIINDLIEKIKKRGRRYAGESWYITSVRCVKASSFKHEGFSLPIVLRVQIKQNGKTKVSCRIWFWKNTQDQAMIKLSGTRSGFGPHPQASYQNGLFWLCLWFEDHLAFKK